MADLTGDLLPVWRFVHAATGVALSSDMKAIGLRRRGRIVAGVLFEGWVGSNVCMHIAIEPGAIVSPVWARYAFAYPFDEVGVRRITAEVAAGNIACRRLVERIGFRVEATLREAARDGEDLLLYRLLRGQCSLLVPQRRADASMATCCTVLEAT